MFVDLALKLEPVLRIVIGTVQRYTDLTIEKNGGLKRKRGQALEN